MSNPYYGGPPTPYGPRPPGPPYGGPPGYPPAPPPKSDVPWIIGVVAAVVISVVTVLVIVVNRSGGEGHSHSAHATATKTTTSRPTMPPAPTVAPAQGITYEIAGSITADLWVNYIDTGGKHNSELVTALPWTRTVIPEPPNAGIFALALDTNHQGEKLDIVITLKRGGQVLRQCHGGEPCLADR